MATLPQFQDGDNSFGLMQNKWGGILNPIIANPIVNGGILKDVQLQVGSNTINHRQGHKLNGYLVVGMKDAYAEIYSTQSPQPTLTLVLNASAATTVDLYVF